MPDMLDGYRPSEWLMLEVLAARYRLGEKAWTFPARCSALATGLEARGLVGWKNGIVEGSILVHLTPAGLTAWDLDGDWEPGAIRDLREDLAGARSDYDGAMADLAALVGVARLATGAGVDGLEALDDFLAANYPRRPLTPIVAVDAGALDLPDGTPVVSVPNEGALP